MKRLRLSNSKQCIAYTCGYHHYQGIDEGDFYTFEGLFQLKQEGSRRCNTMNVLTLYLYKCLSNGRPLNSEDGR